MNDLFGGGAIDVLGTLLGGGSKTKTKSKTGTGGGADKLLPGLLDMLGGAGGLAAIISGFEAGGLGDIIGSWIGTGPNKKVTPGQVKKGLGPERIAQLSAQSGLTPAQVVTHLTTMLPTLVNHATPQGNVPSQSSLEGVFSGLQGLLNG